MFILATQNGSWLPKFAHNDTFILIVSLLALLTLITVIIVLIQDRSFKHFISSLRSEITPAFISWGIGSGITTIVLLVLPEQKDITILLYTIGTLIFYVLFVAFYKDHLNNVSSKLIDRISDAYKKGLVYKLHHDVFFNIKRGGYNSEVIDSIITDQYRNIQNGTFFISKEGYIGMLMDLIDKDFLLFGVNYTVPPYWLSPPNPDSILKVFLKKAESHKEHTKRLNVYKNQSWMQNPTKEILLNWNSEFPQFDQCRVYAWVLNLILELEKGKFINEHELKWFVSNSFDYNAKIDYLSLSDDDLKSSLESQISQDFFQAVYPSDSIFCNNLTLRIEYLMKKLISDDVLPNEVGITKLNEKIGELFYKNVSNGNTRSCLLSEYKSHFNINWVEIMLAERGMSKFGFSVLSDMGQTLSIKVFSPYEYETNKNKFNLLFNSKS